MGQINSTPREMNDALQFGRVILIVNEGDESLFHRVSVHTLFEVALDIDEVRRDSETRMLHDHPALTSQERTSLAALAKKVHDYEASHSKWAVGA